MTQNCMRGTVSCNDEQQVDILLDELINNGSKTGVIIGFADENARYGLQCLADGRLSFAHLAAHGVKQAADLGGSGRYAIYSRL